MPIIPKSDFDCTDHALPILHENNLVEKNYIPPRLGWSTSDFAHSQGGKESHSIHSLRRFPTVHR